MQKHIPLRKCIGCGEMKEKQELFRLIRTEENGERKLVPDIGMKAQCRGAYICKNAACVLKAQKSKRLCRALGMSITDELRDALLELIR